MVRKSGQMGVPVIDVHGKVIVGFNRPRDREGPEALTQPAAQSARAGRCSRAVSNIATMFSGGVPAWIQCDGPRM